MLHHTAKITPLEHFDSIKHKFSGKKTVLVGGCFDLLHYGHYSFLKEAKEQGDILIIALESDEFIRVRKKRIPIHSQNQRAEILAALLMVDYIITLPYFRTDEDYFMFVSKVMPDIIAVTKEDPQFEKKKQQALSIGSIIKEVVPLMPQFSTQKIINSLS